MVRKVKIGKDGSFDIYKCGKKDKGGKKKKQEKKTMVAKLTQQQADIQERRICSIEWEAIIR